MSDMPDCREEFEKRFKTLDFTKVKDAWGKEIYAHSHIQAMFDGYEAAWNARADERTRRALELLDAFEQFDKDTNQIPYGAGDKTKGCAFYNWRKYFVKEIERLCAAAKKEGV